MDRQTLDKVAKLARLALNETEAAEFTAQLQTALERFQQIANVDTEGIEPMVTPTEVADIWRADEVKKEVSAEEMTANAPSRQGHLFSVPPVV